MAASTIDSAVSPKIHQQPLIIRTVARLIRAGAEIVDRIDRRLVGLQTYAAAVCAVALLQIILIAYHSAWLDEAQGLLIALHPGSVQQLLEQLRYEGHPSLWYFILRGLGTFVPYDLVLRAGSLLIAALIGWAILTSDRLSRAERLLLLCSEPVLIEYCSISRSLGLGAALIFVTLRLWRSPWVWLPLALLPQCDFLFGVISILLIALRISQNGFVRLPRMATGIAAWIASSMWAAYTVLPAPDVVTDPVRPFAQQTLVFLSQLGTLAVPLQASLHGVEWNSTYLLGIGFLPAAYFLFRNLAGRALQVRWMTYGLILFLLLFSTFVYSLYFRHITIVSMWLIAVYWVEGGSEPMNKATWRAWLLASAGCGLVTAAAILIHSFDTGERFAKRIEDAGLADASLVSFPDWHSIAVSSALGRPIGGLERRCASSFMRWNHLQVRPISASGFDLLVEHMRSELGDFYLILPADAAVPVRGGQLIMSEPAGFDGMSYALWKIRSGEGSGRELPDCVVGLPMQPRGER